MAAHKPGQISDSLGVILSKGALARPKLEQGATVCATDAANRLLLPLFDPA